MTGPDDGSSKEHSDDNISQKEKDEDSFVEGFLEGFATSVLNPKTWLTPLLGAMGILGSKDKKD